jgi:pimeloyl-ACP methyl ester carboxylesterase
VSAVVFVAPNVPLAPGHPERDAGSQTFDDILVAHEGWARWNRYYWLERYPDFLWYFFAQCFTEPDSTSQIQHFFDMGMQTTPDVLLATVGKGATELTDDLAADFARGLRCPSLVIHGNEDAITPLVAASSWRG